MIRAFVTGASGFLGRPLLEELVTRRVQIRALSRQAHDSSAVVTWVRGDLADSDIVSRAVENCDLVINCAGRTWNSEGGRDPRILRLVNRDAAMGLHEVATRAGTRVFVQVSSTGVIGGRAGRHDEAAECRPENAYELSKREAETALSQACGPSTPALLIVRPSNVFGEGHPRRALLTWFRTVRRGLAVLPSGRRGGWTNYIYVGDVARATAELALRALQTSTPAGGRIVHLNCPATAQELFDASALGLGVKRRAHHLPALALLSLGSACDLLAAVSGRPLPMTLDKARELTSQQVFTADAARLLLPGFPWFGLAEGLRRTCAYYRQEGLL